MAAKSSSQQEIDSRVHRMSLMLIEGVSSESVWQYAAETWGVSERTARRYLASARKLIRDSWNMERSEALALQMSRLDTIYRRSMKREAWNIALGAVNSMTRLVGGNG